MSEGMLDRRCFISKAKDADFRSVGFGGELLPSEPSCRVGS